jgi:hypothetical protein
VTVAAEGLMNGWGVVGMIVLASVLLLIELRAAP